MMYDILKRWLQYLGYDVMHVCNITDIDDKIIQKMQAMNILNSSDITNWYEDRFHEDLKVLYMIIYVSYCIKKSMYFAHNDGLNHSSVSWIQTLLWHLWLLFVLMY